MPYKYAIKSKLEILKIKNLKREQGSICSIHSATKSKETRNTEDSDIEIINPYFWVATITY